ncbi:restriction endonuclease subunit S [uncultured Haemophilus sp.]|uniref:restriction endonuclease subunit S n=1 Tax=uncultured Haemophilus sp. TaxID=237779 RepID=UPI002588AF19|nr:restriction endonuclease subunit S [uncultured Haemophilus sp.]
MSKYYLSDIADFISDKIEFSSIELDKYISTDNMLPNFNGVTLSTVEPSLNKCTKFKAGDTLFSNIRTYFKKVWFADFDGGCSPDVIVMRTKNEEFVLHEFLYLLICSEDFINFTVMSSNGAKMPRGDKKAMLKYEFEIPSIEEQKIAINHYFKIKEKIQLNTQINQTLEQIAQALFKSWFVDFDPVHAKVQALSDGLTLEQVELAAMQAISGKTPEELTALSQTQPDRYAELAETAKAFPYEIVEVDGVEVPKGWEVKRIDEVIQKIPVGKKYSSKTAFSEGLVPILDQGRSGVIGYHNNKPGVKASIEDPIIVFANHTCYMRLISYDFSAIQNVFAFKGKECNLYWLYLATLGKQEFVEYKGHFPDFLIKEIVVPPEELTALFGKYVKESFSKIFINDRENSNLAKIRDLLLPKLLNGEFIR